MSLNIDFYFDFGSPNAYLSYKVIPEIEARIGPAFNLKPALLGGIFKATGNQSPAVTLAAVQPHSRGDGDRIGLKSAVPSPKTLIRHVYSAAPPGI